MAKQKSPGFFCKECGYESVKWMGQCPSCRAWNTLVEAPAPLKASPKRAGPSAKNRPVYLSEVDSDGEVRFDSGFEELNRVLGGGIVRGALMLVGGDPGIGKSTLLLQVCMKMAEKNRRILYISGEESLQQIKIRGDRMGEVSGECKFLCETGLSKIKEHILGEGPDLVIIDSIQTMYDEEVSSAPGSVSQVRESTSALMQIAKEHGISVFIVGHVTKDGQVAGPRLLEHMVDTVLYFEGERSASYRIIRAVKNRFGSTNEIGVFEMGEKGLKEVPNPSEYMLSGRLEGATGSSVACLLEGTRPLLVEVQALVTETAFGLPRRTSVGTDVNRANLLMAVIEKRCRLMMNKYDAYINIAGGLKLSEPALDLSLVLSLVSSLKNRPIPQGTVVFGEVGLAGEVRAVSMPQVRIKEAKKLGFSLCILPAVSLAKLPPMEGIRLAGVKNIQEAVNFI